MTNERVFMGLAVASLCLVGLWHHRWLLNETSKGRRLAAWFGDASALWILRGLLAVGVAFGALLAAGVVRPVEW